jgi:hypothetical protein
MTETDKNKYHNGKIYTIRSYKTDKFYIGSTCMPLHKRFYEHKIRFKYVSLNNLKKYYSSFEILKYDDVYIELLEEFKCENKMELEKREGELIRLHKNNIVNIYINGRTPDEWVKDNKDKRKIIQDRFHNNHKDERNEYSKNYRLNNIDKIKKLKSNKIICSCGLNVVKYNLIKHQETKLHNKLINKE